MEPGCVRLLGSGTDIEVTHCTFEHVHKGVRLKAVGRQDAIDKVVVSDNVFSDADSGGVELADSTTYGDVDPPMGRLYDVRVMRNKFDHIGIRPDLFGQGEALEVEYAQTAEVAGNIFDRVCAQGIDVHGAKPSGAATDRPFTRILIHHNKVVDTLLNNDDFGGIETWQGGPAYVYDNISGNPGGYRNWDHVLNPDAENRFGHAYYLDGAFKNYHFNNIAWGKSKGPAGKLANTSAFQEIISYQNTFFNNTDLQLRARLAPAGAPGRPRQVPGQHLAEHGPARLPRCRSGATPRPPATRPTPDPAATSSRSTPMPTRATSSTTRARASACSSPPGGGTGRSSRSGKPWKATSRWPRRWASWPSSRPCAIRPLTTSGRPPTRRPAAGARRSSCRGASTRRSANGTSTPSRAIRRASWTSTGACPPTTPAATTTTSSPRIRSRASTSP